MNGGVLLEDGERLGLGAALSHPGRDEKVRIGFTRPAACPDDAKQTVKPNKAFAKEDRLTHGSTWNLNIPGPTVVAIGKLDLADYRHLH